MCYFKFLLKIVYNHFLNTVYPWNLVLFMFLYHISIIKILTKNQIFFIFVLNFLFLLFPELFFQCLLSFWTSYLIPPPIIFPRIFLYSSLLLKTTVFFIFFTFINFVCSAKPWPNNFQFFKQLFVPAHTYTPQISLDWFSKSFMILLI